MAAKMQNPGGKAGASLDMRSAKCLEASFTPSDRQAQMLAMRFALSPWIARDVAWLCFGEGCND